MDHIAIGKILQPFRLDGYVKVLIYSNMPERLLNLKTVYIRTNNEYRGYVLDDVQIQPKTTVVKLRGIDSREDALVLTKSEIWIPENQQIDLADDTYFLHQLIGMNVIDGNGNAIGEITAVYQGGGNDVYEVRQGDKEILIPAVAQFVKKVDVDSNQVVVELIEGMID